MPVTIEASRSEWNHLKRQATVSALLKQAFYTTEAETDVNGEITISWTDRTGRPSLAATMIPGGSVNPTHNMVLYMTDYVVSGNDTGYVTFKVVEWDTAIIGADTVLLESATPVQGVRCTFMIVFETELLG